MGAFPIFLFFLQGEPGNKAISLQLLPHKGLQALYRIFAGEGWGGRERLHMVSCPFTEACSYYEIEMLLRLLLIASGAQNTGISYYKLLSIRKKYQL